MTSISNAPMKAWLMRARGPLGGHSTLDSKSVDFALKMYDSKACTVAEITKATGVSKIP